MSITREISLESLKCDKSFFKDIKEGKYVLVLGAGFSFGLPNKSGGTIPIVKEFVEVTNKKFATTFGPGDYNLSADKWQRYIEENANALNGHQLVNEREKKFNEFKSLFLIDENKFKDKKDIYSNILVPRWNHVYTFNFDNVLDVLIQDKKNDYEIQYHEAGTFDNNKKQAIGYLHNSILRAESISDLVFTNNQYAEKIQGKEKDNHLYYALFNDIKTHNKNLIIIGCQFNEQTIYTYLFNKAKGIREDLKIININYNAKPNYGFEVEQLLKDSNWINCSAEDFLKFLQKNKASIETDKILPHNLKIIKEPKIGFGVAPIKYFTDFLESNYLKYLSREEFKKTLPFDERNHFTGEEDLLKFIYSNDYYGLIIHGQGGVGKTRLMLELGKRSVNNNYLPIEVKSNFSDINGLINYLNPENKYILLFDYIEEQNLFEEIIAWVVNNENENIKIIANCRNTILNDIKYKIDSRFKIVNIDAPRLLEDRYKKAIIYSIINSISDKSLVKHLKTKEVLKTFCEARPSFAAFIKYIHAKNKIADFKIVRNEPFEHWLLKRLKFTLVKTHNFNDFFEKKKYIFQFLSCLPADVKVVRGLQAVKFGDILLSDEINKLKKDGWIDENTDDSLKVVHDTVNDTHLLQYLKNFNFDTYYIRDLLEFALIHDSVSSMMYSVQRIWDEIPENNQLHIQVEIFNFLEKSITRSSVKQDWFKYKLNYTPLLEESDRIKLLLTHKKLLKETFDFEKFGSSLSFSMNWLYKNHELTESMKAYYSNELKKLFFEEWNKDGRYDSYYVKSAPLGGNIISCYIKLYGIDDYIKARFNEYITNIVHTVYNLEFISYVLTAWIDNDGEINQRVKEMIVSWFEVFNKFKPEDVDDIFLVKSWLKKGDEISVVLRNINVNKYTSKILSHKLVSVVNGANVITNEIKQLVASWFKFYELDQPEDINSAPLIKNWLQYGDDVTIVANAVKICLNNKNILLSDRAEICGFWLENGNDCKIVEPFIPLFLEGEIWEGTANYIIRFWFEKGNNPLLLKPFLNKWLKIGGHNENLSTVVHYWLENGNEPHIVVDAIKNLLKDNEANNISKGIILTKYVEKNGDIYLIKYEILKWLNDNLDNEQSIYLVGYLLEYVYKKFINPSILRDLQSPTIKLLNKFCLTNNKAKSLSKILRCWTKLGYPNLVEEFIGPFFQIAENQELYECVYLIITWLKETSRPLLVQKAIKPWLNNNGKWAVSLNVSGTWLYKGGELELVADYIKKDLIGHSKDLNCFHVINNWLYRNGDFDLIKPHLLKYLKCHWEHEFGNRLILKCIYLNKIIPEIEFFIFKIKEKNGYNPFPNLIEIRGNSIYKINCQENAVNSLSTALKLTEKIRRYFKKSQSQHLFKIEVNDFLSKYGLLTDASSVLIAWLQYGNDINLIKKSLVKWLGENITEMEDSAKVLSAALLSEVGFNLVHDKAAEWLQKYGEVKESKLVIGAWLKFKGYEGADEIKKYIFYWVEHFYDINNTTWEDDLIINYTLDNTKNG